MSRTPRYKLELHGNAANRLPLAWEDADGQPVDLTVGWGGAMQIRRFASSQDALVSLTEQAGDDGQIELGAGGEVTLVLSPAALSKLPVWTCVYDVVLYPPGDTDRSQGIRLVEGRCVLSRGVTRG